MSAVSGVCLVRLCAPLTPLRTEWPLFWTHNYSFTLATTTNFTYQGNESFGFTGDDDVFVFINRHLAIDLGGVHDAESATVNLAERAQEFEITPGNRYPIHIFFAERHPTRSDFVVETSIADIGACP